MRIWLKLFLFLLVSLLLHSCGAHRKLKKNLDQTFTGAPEFRQAFVGFALYDPQARKMLYSHNDHKYFTPASNTKLLTFYTGLKILGDSAAAFRYRISNDSLFFTGTGDPSFLNPNFENSRALQFLQQRDETLVMVQPAYTEKQQGPGWAWDDYNAYYSAERTPFPLYGNLVEFRFTTDAEKPQISPMIFSDSLRLTKKEGESTRIQRRVNANRFSLHNLQWEKDHTQRVPFHYSPELTARLLSDTLNRPVHLTRDSVGPLPHKFYSIPSDSLYKRMLEVSDNFIAEQLLLMAADRLSDSLRSDIAIRHMKETYLKDLPDEVFWVDGSGLSRYNLFTPRSLVRLLEKIREEVPQEQLLNLLATGGVSGTLENYYKAGKPYVWAKTGTLRNNHSLSGYLLTKKGRWLIFSFMNSNYTVPGQALKAQMELILRAIRDNY